MNYSKQRKVILNYVNTCFCHPTADKVYEEVKKELPSISFSTVYRNLNQLVEQKMIKKISLDGEKYIYDNITREHAHFYCICCGMLEDLDFYKDIKLLKKRLPYEVESIELVVKGICNNCRKE